MLVIEDDARLLATLTRHIERMGYDASPCASADAVTEVAMALREPPLAVVADVRLAGGADGIHAVARIRNLFARVPALIMTGQPSLEIEAVERLHRLGAGVEFKRKPVELDVLRDFLQLATHLATLEVPDAHHLAAVVQDVTTNAQLTPGEHELLVYAEDILGNVSFKADISEDDKGRVTARDFTSGHANLKDSYFLYDKLDRVTCETDYSTSSCPTAPDARIKNSHDLSPPFTQSNDWKQVQRPIAGGWAKTDHVVTLGTGKDQISTIGQPCAGCPTALGTTSYSYDARGNRISDDNTSSLTHDARSYTYDGRRNATTVSGKYYTSGTWHNYTMTSAFDARNRRVFKSFLDTTASKESHYFFYYDPMDRLTEIRQTPDIASPTTYSVYQIVWIGDRAVHMWETDYPSATTKRFYFHTDETTRPLETYDWPTSGNATRYWSTNPDAYGNDTCLGGCSVLQPFVFPGQYRDAETVAWQNDGVTQHRSAMILDPPRSYDSFVAAHIQVDSASPGTWNPYGSAPESPPAASLVPEFSSSALDFNWNELLPVIDEASPIPKGCTQMAVWGAIPVPHFGAVCQGLPEPCNLWERVDWRKSACGVGVDEEMTALGIASGPHAHPSHPTSTPEWCPSSNGAQRCPGAISICYEQEWNCRPIPLSFIVSHTTWEDPVRKPDPRFRPVEQPDLEIE